MTLWTGRHDFLGTSFLEQLEVFDEAGGQGIVFLPVVLLIAPGAGWIQNVFRYIGAGHGNIETKELVLPIFHLIQFAIQGAVEKVACVMNANAFPNTEPASHPTSVNEPATNIVLEHSLL